jgi:hypothetical protein
LGVYPDEQAGEGNTHALNKVRDDVQICCLDVNIGWLSGTWVIAVMSDCGVIMHSSSISRRLRHKAIQFRFSTTVIMPVVVSVVIMVVVVVVVSVAVIVSVILVVVSVSMVIFARVFLVRVLFDVGMAVIVTMAMTAAMVMVVGVESSTVIFHKDARQAQVDNHANASNNEH